MQGTERPLPKPCYGTSDFTGQHLERVPLSSVACWPPRAAPKPQNAQSHPIPEKKKVVSSLPPRVILTPTTLPLTPHSLATKVLGTWCGSRNLGPVHPSLSVPIDFRGCGLASLNIPEGTTKGSCCYYSSLEAFQKPG